METTETIKPLVEVIYRVSLVAEVDTERGEVRRVTLYPYHRGVHEAVEIQGDLMGAPITEAMSDDEIRAAIDSAVKIAETTEWPEFDYEG